MVVILTGTSVRSQGGAPSSLTVVTRLDDEESERLRQVFAEWTLHDPDLAGLEIVMRRFTAESRGDLPAMGWDIAVGYPAFILQAAATAGELLPLDDGGHFVVFRTVPYGIVTGSTRGTPLTWRQVLRGEGYPLLLPNPAVEPEFQEALASLLAGESEEAIRSLLLRRGNGPERTRGIRQELRRSPNDFAIVALSREECELRERLPAGRLGIAVSAATTQPRVAKRLVAMMTEAGTRRRWAVSDVGFAPGASGEPPTWPIPGPERAAVVVALAGAARDRDDSAGPVGDWLETALLIGFGGLFAFVLLTAVRRR